MTNAFVIGAVAATQVLPNTIWRPDGSGARLNSRQKHTGMTDFDILLGSKRAGTCLN